MTTSHTPRNGFPRHFCPTQGKGGFDNENRWLQKYLVELFPQTHPSALTLFPVFDHIFLELPSRGSVILRENTAPCTEGSNPIARTTTQTYPGRRAGQPHPGDDAEVPPPPPLSPFFAVSLYEHLQFKFKFDEKLIPQVIRGALDSPSRCVTLEHIPWRLRKKASTHIETPNTPYPRPRKAYSRLAVKIALMPIWPEPI